MSNVEPIHKRRSIEERVIKRQVYASQCHVKILLQCSACLLTKSPKHCHIFKNISSLWQHLKRDHGEFVNSKFSSDDVCEVLNNLAKAIQWGIILRSDYNG